MACRFKYPMELLDQSKIIEEPPDSNMYRYMGKRNDELVNSHNRDVTQTWRANTDWSAVITKESVVHYIAKYAAKSEPASKNFNETLRGIVEDRRNPCNNSASAIRRLLIKCVSERDISAQETCHLIMGYPLNRSSRKFVLLNLNENSMFSRALRRRRNVQNEDSVATNQSFIGRYMHRRPEFENVTLLNMAKRHYWARGDWRTYKTEEVVRIIPEFNGPMSPNSPKWEEFCRHQVLLLHHYRSMDDAKGGFERWSDRYNQLGLQDSNNPVQDIDDEFEDDSEENDRCYEEWMEAAAQGPRGMADITIDLGMREVDMTYDWGKGVQNYPNIEIDRRFVRSILQSQDDQNHDASNNQLLIDLNQLSPEQKNAHDLVLNSLIQRSTIRLIVSGGAGTGKSTLINAIVDSTRKLFINRKSVRIMAPTGVAAFNIGGSTIHHELGIYGDSQSNHHYKDLEGESLGKMQEDFKDAKLLIIDEYNMIGRKLLANIDFRCRNIFSEDNWFGNISIVLVGDIRQLPPVRDSTLYSEGGFYMQRRGALSYASFDKCITLSQVFRQSGGEQAVFRDALLRLSDGDCSYEDWELFKTRDFVTLNQHERDYFKSALRLFPTRKNADQCNIESLRALNRPVARIASINNCSTATNADADEAKGLQQVILLSIGSRVMLQTNLATNHGLVNGARGIVEDIVYAPGQKSPTDMPLAIMVNFDDYHGPKFKPPTNIIPIVPQTASWKTSSGTTCQRTQIPLVLCWAITVHKSQGLTLDKAVVDIGEKESLGLTFVALSRTRKLTDLAFSPMFGFESLQNIKKCKGLPGRRQEEQRLRQLSMTTLSNS